MKIIKIVRGGSRDTLTLANVDRYDSAIEVINSAGALIYRGEHVNTDPTIAHHGGVLAQGVYYYFIGLHKGTYRAPLLFTVTDTDRLVKIRQSGHLTLSERTLPSIVPNPAQGGRMIMTCVNIHKGGKYEDLSEGCITIYPAEWDGFIACFEAGEIGYCELIQVSEGRRT
ncbi:MAG: hypothetical protein HPY53_04865 [Brevinematales bacterium]|nr:hypothetical protein [Brevinematales bacterium]